MKPLGAGLEVVALELEAFDAVDGPEGAAALPAALEVEVLPPGVPVL